MRMRAVLAALLALTGCDDDGGSPTQINAPPGEQPDAGPPAPGCAADADCAEGTCRTDVWPGGHCTRTDCLAAGCQDGATCVDDGAGGFCAEACEGETCREGYACLNGACLPAEDPNARWDGAPCLTDEECGGGACLQAPDWPEGHCTTPACESAADCSPDPLGLTPMGCFISVREDNFCVRACERDADCRYGYSCEPLDGARVCLADPNPPMIREEDALAHPMDVTCVDAGEADRLRYPVSADAYSYLVVPFSPSGDDLRATAIDLPDGERIDLEGDNAFQGVNGFLHGFMSPTVVPATEAHAAAGQIQAGENTYRLDPRGARVCSYVLETRGPGDRIDLNIYFVGLEELNAETARDDFDFNQALERFEMVWAKMDVALGTVRYFDVDPVLAERYRIIRNDRELAAILETTRPPGDTLDDALSVNVVIVAGFAVPRRPQLGSSEGLPGPAGLHGSRASGVVMTAEFMGEFFRTVDVGFVNGNEFTGDTLAHEVGHYLGLRHTTEQTLEEFDPLDDTPRCDDEELFPEDCPDRTNLMFPFAGDTEPVVTEGQSWMVRANPLAKQE